MRRGSDKNGDKRSNREELLALERRVDIAPRGGGDLRVHLTYPNTYWVGMSNLGFQAVFGIFSNQSGVVIERAFLPEAADEEEKRLELATFESKRSLMDCDVLGFSLSFETDYPNLARMLHAGNLLGRSANERDALRDRNAFAAPLLIAGGTAVTLNPEPVANFLDVIVIGEAEELIPEMSQVLRDAKSEQCGREELLYRLAQLEGVYVPRFYSPKYSSSGTLVGYDAEARVPKRPQRRFVKDLSKFPTYSRILTPETEFKSMFLTETGRGCEMGCRFCVAGYIYRPIRKRSEEAIADTLKIGLEQSSAVGFVGASVSSHRAITRLTTKVAESGARASLSSIMSQMVSKELSASLSESEYKTVALAPEAGSTRLRRAIGKRVVNEQVVGAARMLAEAEIRGFKLYFMVGLPTEEDCDIDAIAHLSIAVRNVVREVSHGRGKGAWVQLSVNPFIPKASTPFQWEPMIETKVLSRKIDRIKAIVGKEKNIELRFEPPRESYFQALLSRGDRRVSEYLYEAAIHGEGWKWILSQGEKLARKEAMSIEYYAKRRFEFEEFLPWEVIDSRIDRELLLREAMRAHHGESWGKAKSDGELPAAQRGEAPDVQQDGGVGCGGLL